MTDLFPLTIRTRSKRTKKPATVNLVIGPPEKKGFSPDALTFERWPLVAPKLSPKSLHGWTIGLSVFSGGFALSHASRGHFAMTDREIATLPRRVLREAALALVEWRKAIGSDAFAERHPRAARFLVSFRDFEPGDRVRVWGHDARWYTGKAVSVGKGVVEIAFDDGGRDEHPIEGVDLDTVPASIVRLGAP